MVKVTPANAVCNQVLTFSVFIKVMDLCDGLLVSQSNILSTRPHIGPINDKRQEKEMETKFVFSYTGEGFRLFSTNIYFGC